MVASFPPYIVAEGMNDTGRATRSLNPAKGFLGGASDKEPPYQCRKPMRLGFDPWVRKIP